MAEELTAQHLLLKEILDSARDVKAQLAVLAGTVVTREEFTRALEGMGTRGEVAALQASLLTVTTQVNKLDALRPDQRLESLERHEEEHRASRVPTWVLMGLGPVAATIVAHFWK